MSLEIFFSALDVLRIALYTPIYMYYLVEYLYLAKISSYGKWQAMGLFLFFFTASFIVVLDNSFYTVIPSQYLRHLLTIPALLIFIFCVYTKRIHFFKRIYFKDGKLYLDIKL